MISYQSLPGSSVAEIRVEGRVTNAELEAVMNRLSDDIERRDVTRLVEVIEYFTGIEPAALWTDIKLGLPLANKVTRVAVVADQAWIRALTHLGVLFTRARIKSFEPAEIEAARLWAQAD